jgi:hypothetical protein
MRVESIMMLLAIAIYEDLVMFKVDIASALMMTPMVKDAKHEWVQLDKLVVKILLELHPGEYEEYVLKNGTMIREMRPVSYGLVEAAHYWHKNLDTTFSKNAYKPFMKDKCVYIMKTNDKVAYCVTTVDCFFVMTKDIKWMNAQIKMLKEAYEVINAEHGEILGLIGMHMKMD